MTLKILKGGGFDISKLMPTMKILKHMLYSQVMIWSNGIFHIIAYVYYYGVVHFKLPNSYKFGPILGIAL